MRIGTGIDVHALVYNRPLVLGGVRIDSPMGLEGHSDADVLTHALMDALLSAARLPDIGELFPEDDDAYEGADSLELLKLVRRMVAEAGFAIGDVDLALCAQTPKVSPYKERIRATLAGALEVPVASVGLKATTFEHLGFVGRGEGILAMAACILCDSLGGGEGR